MESPVPPDAVTQQPAVPAVAAPAAVPPAPDLFALTWLRRYFQSNLVLLLLCAFLYFSLLRDILSLNYRLAAALVTINCWQGLFVLCLVERRRLPWLWPACRTTVVVLFVGWHLFFLFVRNPLDFWHAPIRSWCEDQEVWEGVRPWLEPVDDATRHYGNFNGIDQNWRMFTPPLSRYATFLAARVEFTDGSEAVVLSENEPDPQRFFRFGGWRQRKLEDQLAYENPSQLESDIDLPLCQAYACWSLRRWRDQHADDPRTPARVVLVRRTIALSGPDAEPAGTPIGTFLPDGSLVP